MALKKVKIKTLKNGDYFSLTKSYKAISYIYYGITNKQAVYNRARSFRFFKTSPDKEVYVKSY